MFRYVIVFGRRFFSFESYRESAFFMKNFCLVVLTFYVLRDLNFSHQQLQGSELNWLQLQLRAILPTLVGYVWFLVFVNDLTKCNEK